MGQIEVYEWLKARRSLGDNRYFTAREIEKGLKDEDLLQDNGYSKGSVKIHLLNLERFGYLDARRKGKLSDYNRVFRLKDKFVVQNTKSAKFHSFFDDDLMKR